MSQRFFADQPVTTPTVVLAGAEAQHLTRVMRGKIGDRIILFDDSGYEFTATIREIRKDDVVVEILSKRQSDPPLAKELTVGVCLPKGDRQRWMVEKLTEVGVTRFVPLLAHRSVAQPVDRVVARLQRNVVEACKQCGRNRLMTIEPASNLTDYLGRPSAGDLRLFADLDGETGSLAGVSRDTPAFVAIGPEGGWTDEEVQSAKDADWQVVKLDGHVLRTETAAMVLASRLAYGSS